MNLEPDIKDILAKLGITSKNIHDLFYLTKTVEILKAKNILSNNTYLKIQKLKTQLKHKPKKILKTKNPVLFFNTIPQDKDYSKFSKYYEKWGWEITCNLYEIQNDPIRGNINKIYNYTLTLLKFFNILDSLEKENFKFDYKSFYEFKNFEIELLKDKLIEKDLEIIKKVITFIKKDFKRNYEKVSPQTISKKEKFQFYTKNFQNDEDEYPYNSKIIKQIPKYDEFQEEKETIYHIDNQPEIPSKRDYFNKYYKKVSILKSNIHLITSQNSITLNEVLYIYKNFDALLNSNNQQNEYLIFLGLVVLSLNTGISISEWKEILLKNHSIAKISKIDDIFFYYYKNPLKVHVKIKKIINSFVHEVKDKIKIFLPPDLQNITEKLLKNKKILKEINVSKNLKRLNKNYPYSFRFTEKRIQYFFFNYFIDKYNLDALFVEYISLMRDQFSYSPQHYTTISLYNLNYKYFKSYENLCNDLNIKYNKSFADKILSKINKNENIGSLVVLQKEYVINFFNEIYKYLKDKKTISLIEEFNFKTIYLYYLLQLCTGHRPVIEPEYNEKNFYFSENFSILIIRDKSLMPRVIPLCKFLYTQLNHHKEFCRNITKNYKLTKVDTIFYLIDRNKFSIEYKDFSTKNINELFYKKINQQYSYLPRNFFRHYFRSYLTEKNYDSKFIDWLMGHYILGQEMLNKYSTLNLQAFRIATLKLQENIIKKHGIRKIY